MWKSITCVSKQLPPQRGQLVIIHASMHKKTAIKRCSRENKLWKFEGKFFPTTNMISCTCLEHKSGAMKSRRRHMLLIRIYTFVGIADPWKKSLPPL